MTKENVINYYTLALEVYYLGAIDESIITFVEEKIREAEEKNQFWLKYNGLNPIGGKSPTFDALDLDKIFHEIKEKVNPEELKNLSKWAKIGRIQEMGKNLGGSTYTDAEFCGKNFFIASKLYEKALELGDNDAICNLVKCYSMCALAGAAKDFDKYFHLALKYKQKAEEENLSAKIPCSEMISYLGERLEKSENVQELFDTIFAFCVQEHGETAPFLEEYYFYGIGVKEDFKKAFECFKKQDHSYIVKAKDIVWFNDWWWCKSRLAKNSDDYAILGYAKYEEYNGRGGNAVGWYNRVKDSKFEDVRADALAALAVLEKGGRRENKEIMGNDGYKYLPNEAYYWENMKFDFDEVWAEYNEPGEPREEDSVYKQVLAEGKVLFGKGKAKENAGDIKDAIELYTKASNLGSQQASIRLCDFYATANCVDPSLESVRLYYNRSAVDYHDEYSCFIGAFTSYCFVLRYGKEPSDEDIKCLGEGRYMVYLYFTGWQNQDIEEALYWLNKSAETGYNRALLKLAEYYTKGEHVEKDLEKAKQYYEMVGDEEDEEPENEYEWDEEPQDELESDSEEESFCDDDEMFYYEMMDGEEDEELQDERERETEEELFYADDELPF